MIPLNLLELLFLLMSLCLLTFSYFLNVHEKVLPSFLRRIFRYGKFSYRGPIAKASLLVIEVPKSWFRHFYIYSAVLSVVTLNIVILVYFFDSVPPRWLLISLDFFVSPRRVSFVTPAATVLAMFLLTIQCLRRVYDTHFVSVFNANGYINLSHYLIGYIHYTSCILCIFSSAPKIGQHAYRYPLVQISDLTFFDILATVLFLWAWYHQYKATVILAMLRKNQKGQVVTQKHKVPHGDLFNYVASPHLLTEILMYISLTIILWQNSSWFYIFSWVLINQTETALLSYWWYKETFPDFPKDRKALIPYIL